MKKTFLYVDGFNLYYSAVRKTPLRWLNPIKLAGLVFPKNEIVCHKFFTAKVLSRPSNPHQSLRQYFYWRALSTLPQTEIILGDFRTRQVNAPVVNPPPDYIQIYKTEEKGSDVNLASQFPKELSDQMGTFR